MNAQQAIDLLSKITGQVNLTREGHLQVLEAIKTIQGAIAPKKETKDGK